MGALIVALLATSGVAGLRHYATSQLQAVITLTHIEGDANALASLEWQTMARENLTPELNKAVELYTNRMSASLDALKAQGAPGGSQSLQHLDEAFRNYRTPLDEEFRLLKLGQLDQASALDDRLVDPGYNALTIAIAEAKAAYEQRA